MSKSIADMIPEWYEGESREPEMLDEALAQIRNLEAALANRPEISSRETIVRHNDRGTLDEVFAGPCEFHMEQMDNGHWWIGINAADKFFHINLHARGTIKAMIESEARHEPQSVTDSPTKEK